MDIIDMFTAWLGDIDSEPFKYGDQWTFGAMNALADAQSTVDAAGGDLS